MYGGKDNIRCVDVELFPVSESLDMTCFGVTKEAEFSVFGLAEPMQISCFKICTVSKDIPCWLWDAGEKILWDNNEEKLL